MLAWQTLANESELVRRTPFASLGALHRQPFRSDLELVDSLGGVSSMIEVSDSKPMLKEVVLKLTWDDGRRNATVTVLRSDTGGTNLW